MNAIGWQVGAVLFGVSVLIIAIYQYTLSFRGKFAQSLLSHSLAPTQ